MKWSLVIPGMIIACVAATLFVGIKTRPASRSLRDPDAKQVSDRRGVGSPLFEDATESSGIDFRHKTETPGSYFFPEIVSSGCALLDFDADGDLDVYLVNLGTGYLKETSAALNNAATNRLYEQYEPLRFRDVTDHSGLGDRGYGMGVAVADINNDGLVDVYVTNYGPDRLYLNAGGGQFRDITSTSGIDNPMWGASASFFDYDLDGRLDLFVTNYVDDFAMPCTTLSGINQEYCAPHVFPATPDKLYRNMTGDDRTGSATDDTDVRFVDVSVAAGISQVKGPGLGVATFDFTDDGRPDIYVANDQTANSLWVNRGDGTFEDEAVLLGVAYDSLGRPQAGMGVTLGDVHNDLKMDLFITHFEGEHNALYSRRGPVYHDISLAVGLGEPGFDHTGFGTAMLDIELDGDLDLVVANGRVKRKHSDTSTSSTEMNPNTFWDHYSEVNQIFINSSSGRFHEYKSSRDAFVSDSYVSRGLAAGDVDNDGDVDLLVTNTGGRAQLFLNTAVRQGNWLCVRAIDPNLGGRDAYGAIVTTIADGRSRVRVVNPGLSYLSSGDPRVFFGLGTASTVDRVDIRWPDGLRESFPGGLPNRSMTALRGEGEPRE